MSLTPSTNDHEVLKSLAFKSEWGRVSSSRRPVNITADTGHWYSARLVCQAERRRRHRRAHTCASKTVVHARPCISQFYRRAFGWARARKETRHLTNTNEHDHAPSREQPFSRRPHSPPHPPQRSWHNTNITIAKGRNPIHRDSALAGCMHAQPYKTNSIFQSFLTFLLR